MNGGSHFTVQRVGVVVADGLQTGRQGCKARRRVWLHPLKTQRKPAVIAGSSVAVQICNKECRHGVLADSYAGNHNVFFLGTS